MKRTVAWSLAVGLTALFSVTVPSASHAATDQPAAEVGRDGTDDALAADADDLDPGPFTATSTNDPTVTELRPLLREICPGDGLRAALHWKTTTGPFEPHGVGRQDPRIDLLATLDSLTFKIGLPDGTVCERKAKFTDRRSEWAKNEHAAHRWATIMLTIDAAGVQADTVQGALQGKWAEPLPPDALRSFGHHHLTLSGRLVGRNSTFTAGPVRVTVAEGPIPVVEARKKALASIVEHLPEATIPADQAGTESGLMRGMVYENARGERIVHVRVLLNQQKWGYDLAQVRQSRTGELLGLAHCGVFTCVAAGTPIATPTGARAIETLRVGDEVKSYDVDRGTHVTTRVVGLRAARAPAVLRFGDLRVTGEHPIYTPAGFEPAARIGAESRVFGMGGSWLPIAAGERVDGETEVWCLSVGPPHTYFASGILVHNKERSWSANLDDPWYFYWAKDGQVRKGAWKKLK